MHVASIYPASGQYSAYLAQEGYMQFGSYYVLLVKPRHAEKVGRIFDATRSGRNVYVEPNEVVELTDELLESQKELKLLVRRILGTMSLALSHSAKDIRRCLEAAARIDLARARLFLGEDMEGEVPNVGDDGIIEVKQARNPCLILRGGKRVVGYRLELGKSSQGLLLTGPNAGGKTVVLKTLGLLALLARCGIPVPAGESPRVDFFEVVLADVGDMQTIVDDLSTYSAHLVASRIMLSSVQHVGPRAMVLVDEAGTGTDPQQGAALARAMLEAFLESGARVVATTHCAQLKNWATEANGGFNVSPFYKEDFLSLGLFQHCRIILHLTSGTCCVKPSMDVAGVQLQEIGAEDGWPRLLTAEEVAAILAIPGNDSCADCAGGPPPSWASVTFGVVQRPANLNLGLWGVAGGQTLIIRGL
eukprot:s2344_g4.t1